METRQNEIYSLLMPAAGDSVLLPNIAVAEVVPYFGNVDKPTPGAPPWLLGYLQWRGRHVPLMAMEAMAGGELPQLTRLSRLAILNTANGSADVLKFSVLHKYVGNFVTDADGQPIDATVDWL